MSRCGKCSQLNSTNFSNFLDAVPHHPSFESVEREALAGCTLCQIFVWNARLHQPQLGLYDVHLQKARAATGSVRLTREESRVVLNIGGSPANNTSNFACAADFQSDLATYNEPTTVPDRYDADTVKDRLMAWLSSCDATHKGECQARSSYFADGSGPARLLELGSTTTPRLRLRPVGPREGYKYAALSYIWGAEPHGAMTLNSNLEERMHGISLESLPRVYRETIGLCRLLDIGYLWIDALCIIQPSPEDGDRDWQEQSAIMGSIYTNAYLTIAAAATQSADDSLFAAGRIIHNIPPPCRLFSDPSEPELYVVPTTPLWVIQISHSPLQNRGWVFQERLLSRRIVHLTRYEACWECPQLIATEHQPNGIPAESQNKALMYNQFGCWRPTRPPDKPVSLSDEEYFIARLWPLLVERYTDRRLTHHSDILPAIGAVAKLIHSVAGTEYVAGFWLPLSAFDLAWRGAWDATHPKERHRPQNSTNPSWSWTSLIGHVYLHSFERTVKEGKPHLKIAHASAKPVYEYHPFGHIVPGSAYLKITGIMLRRRGRRAETAFKQKDPHSFQFATTFEAEQRMMQRPNEFKAEKIGMVDYDALEEAAEHAEFSLLLPLERAKSENERSLTAPYPYFRALALVPEVQVTSTTSGQECIEMETNKMVKYRRVGFATTWDDRMFDPERVQEVTITLV